MPVSGLIVTLDRAPDVADAAVRAIAQRDDLTLGQRAGVKLPLVSDTADKTHDKALWSWLQRLPGVVHVDVVMIHFDESSSQVAYPEQQQTMEPVR